MAPWAPRPSRPGLVRREAFQSLHALYGDARKVRVHKGGSDPAPLSRVVSSVVSVSFVPLSPAPATSVQRAGTVLPSLPSSPRWQCHLSGRRGREERVSVTACGERDQVDGRIRLRRSRGRRALPWLPAPRFGKSSAQGPQGARPRVVGGSVGRSFPQSVTKWPLPLSLWAGAEGAAIRTKPREHRPHRAASRGGRAPLWGFSPFLCGSNGLCRALLEPLSPYLEIYGTSMCSRHSPAALSSGRGGGAGRQAKEGQGLPVSTYPLVTPVVHHPPTGGVSHASRRGLSEAWGRVCSVPRRNGRIIIRNNGAQQQAQAGSAQLSGAREG